MTPHFVNFGQELKLSGDEYRHDKPQNVEQYVNKKLEDLEKIKEKVIEEMRKASEATRKRYNLRARDLTYKQGDIVWRKNFTLSDASKNYTAKLGSRYLKCVVLRRIGTNCYELGNMAGKSLGNFQAKDFYADGNVDTDQKGVNN
jgi:hypothetical protein